MRMTVEGYAAVVGSLRDVATRHGALALATEGGYDLMALTECLEASIAVLDGEPAPVIEAREAPRGARAAAAARAALKPFWRAL
jgi:acetoin utilization deacetylase AcuC-like enzyme